MSTNTPKSITFRTVPVSTMPGFRSFMSSTSVRRMGAGRSLRRSRPGFISSFTTSRSVGTPTPISSATFASPMACTFRINPSTAPRRTSSSPQPHRASSFSAAP